MRTHSVFFAATAFLMLSTSARAQAGNTHIETGQVSFSETIGGDVNVNDTAWVQVSFAQAYSSVPVVVVGPVAHTSFASQKAEFSLSTRVRNVTTTGCEIGAQRPNGTVTTLGAPLTADYLVMEEGRYILPDGLLIEAHLHITSTVRSGASGGAGDIQFFDHAYSAEPGVLHSVQTANSLEWITSTAFGSGNSQPPNTSTFSIALEGAEVVKQHPAAGPATSETIGWVAFEQGTGTLTDSLGAILAYDAGRTTNYYVNRHDLGCYRLPVSPAVFGFGQVPRAIVAHNSMQGSNGAWVRRCHPNASPGADLTVDGVYVHMEEDQVGDSERTGIPEFAAWFAMEPGAGIAVERYQALPSVSKTAQDSNGGLLVPGDELRYDLSLANAGRMSVADIAGLPELYDAIPTGTTYVAGSLSASAGTASYNSSLGRVEWNGTITQASTVTLSFRVTLANSLPHGSSIGNQAILQYDSDGDGAIDAAELSDDPSTPAANDATVVTVTAVSASASSVAASPASITADGASTATLTVTLQDDFGNRVSGQSVTLLTDQGTLLGSMVDAGNGQYTQDLQSGTSLATATLTVTANGSLLTGVETRVDFVAGLAVDAASSIVASPTVLTVGPNQASVTVTLTDAFGNPVAGQAVEIATSLGLMAGSVVDQGNGTYVQNLVASQTTGTATLTFKVNGVDFGDSAQVSFVAGTPDPSRSSMGASPAAIIADGSSTTTITITLRDSYDNPVSGQSVVLATSAGSLGAISDLGNGQYRASLTSSSVAQTVTLSYTVNGSGGYGDGQVDYVAGPVDLSLSSISANPTVIVNGTGSSLITALVVDSNGNPIAGQTVSMATSGTCSFAAQGVVDHGDGSYTRSLNAGAVKETCTVSFTIGGQAAANSADVSVVSNGPLDANSSIGVSPSTLIAGSGGTAVVTVTLRDDQNQPAPGHTVEIFTDLGSLSAVVDPGDGSYTATFTAPSSAGLATLSFSVNGTGYTDTASVDVVPADPVDAASTISAAPTSIVANGADTSMVTVLLVDAYGNPVPGRAVFVTTTAGALSGVNDQATDNGDGSYSITLSSSTNLETALLGFYVASLAVTFADTASVNFVTGPLDPSSATIGVNPNSLVADGANQASVTVQLDDSYGHAITGTSVVCDAGGRGSFGAASENPAGTYTLIYTVDTLASPVVITCQAGGQALADSATLNLQPGPADPSQTTVAVGSATLTADGSSSTTVQVVVRDANGNLIDSANVAATSTLGHVDATATGQGAGVYVATFVSGSALGTAQIVIDVDGIGGFTAVTVDLIPAGPSNSDSTITVDNAQLRADGSSTTTVHVTVMDAYGHALGGEAVVISSTAGSLLGAVTDNGSGSYTQTLQAPTLVGQASLTFSVGGLNFDPSATVDFVAGPADDSRSSIAASPSVLVADGSATAIVMVQILDANDNPVAGRSVAIATSSGSLGAVTETSPGHHEATLTAPTSAGAASLSFSVDGITYTDTATVTFTSGAAVDDNSSITTTDSRLLADGSSTTTVTVDLRDANGNGVSGATVVVNTTAGSLSAPVQDLGDGRYMLTLTADASPGTATLSFRVEGTPFGATTNVIFVADGGDLDDDNDGVVNRLDNCRIHPNPGQENNDADRAGDACDLDDDNDGVDDILDNCPMTSNAEQADLDADGVGDACDSDRDDDGVNNGTDLCPWVSDNQSDSDSDGVGDACDHDNDADADGVDDGVDLCPAVADPGQADQDGDGLGDACDSDTDGDGVIDGADNCPAVANHGQANHDTDAAGDACDDDDDGDGLLDGADNCPPVANPGQAEVCLPDGDGDGLPDSIDNCPTDLNVDQADRNGDGVGDACDVIGEDAGNSGDASSDSGAGDLGPGTDAGPAGDSSLTDTGTPDRLADDQGASGDGSSIGDAASNLEGGSAVDSGPTDLIGVDLVDEDAHALDSSAVDTSANSDAGPGIDDAGPSQDASGDAGIGDAADAGTDDAQVVAGDGGGLDALTNGDGGQADNGMTVTGGGCACRSGASPRSALGLLALLLGLALRRRRSR